MKKNKRIFNLLLFSLTILLFSSCKKKEITYQFEGKVNSSLDGNPVSDVAVSISQKVISNNTSATKFKLAGSDKTNSAGDFFIEFGREKVTEFSITYQKENYFDLELEESASDFTTEGVNKISKNIEPKSWVSFDLENLFAEDADHFRLVTHTFREGCKGCAINETQNYIGTLDTVITYATTAGEYVRYSYVNVTTGFSKYDSVYTTPFETTTITIHY